MNKVHKLEVRNRIEYAKTKNKAFSKINRKNLIIKCSVHAIS